MPAPRHVGDAQVEALTASAPDGSVRGGSGSLASTTDAAIPTPGEVFFYQVGHHALGTFAPPGHVMPFGNRPSSAGAGLAGVLVTATGC